MVNDVETGNDQFHQAQRSSLFGQNSAIEPHAVTDSQDRIRFDLATRRPRMSQNRKWKQH